MAENYNLNAKFGLNVLRTNSQNNNSKQANKLEIPTVSLFDHVNGYMDKYEGVFDGSVGHDIAMYERQAMIIGMNLRNADNKHEFDLNI